MISNEHPSPFRRWPHLPQRPSSWSNLPPKPPVNEDTLKSSQIQIERKIFVLTLKENMRGRLLRITEDINGRRNSIIIPSTGLVEFKKLLEEMIQASNELQSPNSPPVNPE